MKFLWVLVINHAGSDIPLVLAFDVQPVCEEYAELLERVQVSYTMHMVPFLRS